MLEMYGLKEYKDIWGLITKITDCCSYFHCERVSFVLETMREICIKQVESENEENHVSLAIWLDVYCICIKECIAVIRHIITTDLEHIVLPEEMLSTCEDITCPCRRHLVPETI